MSGSAEPWAPAARSTAGSLVWPRSPRAVTTAPSTPTALSSALKNKRGPQSRAHAVEAAGTLVKFQPPAVGAGDGGDQRQAQARAGLVAAVLQSHEPFHH